jgi:hypothetical protein
MSFQDSKTACEGLGAGLIATSFFALSWAGATLDKTQKTKPAIPSKVLCFILSSSIFKSVNVLNSTT